MPGSASTIRSVPSGWMKVILAMTLAKSRCSDLGDRAPVEARARRRTERERGCPLAARCSIGQLKLSGQRLRGRFVATDSPPVSGRRAARRYRARASRSDASSSRKRRVRPWVKASPESASARSAAAAVRQAPIAEAEPLSEWAASFQSLSDAAARSRRDRSGIGCRTVRALLPQARGRRACSATDARDRPAGRRACAPPRAAPRLPRLPFRSPFAVLPRACGSQSGLARNKALRRLLGAVTERARRLCDLFRALHPVTFLQPRVCLIAHSRSCFSKICKRYESLRRRQP